MEARDCCELLAWDSDFFGFNVARLRGYRLTDELSAQVDEWCQAHRIWCLYFQAAVDDPWTTRIAEREGFELMDIRVTFRRAVDRLLDKANMRLATVEDLEALRALARRSYHDTRFYYDRRFPRQRCHDLYATWISNSVHGYADAVWVVEEASDIAGYISCHVDARRESGRIGLLAVDPKYRGKGVASSLVEWAVTWFASRNAGHVEVITQARNIAAQSLYQMCGFRTWDVKLYYHKWYTTEENP